MKIAHESPISLMPYIQCKTDYDYALVHLFETHPEYYQFFEESLKKGREVILDNSVFELGKSYNEESYRKWILTLRPTYFIIPDVLNNCIRTLENIQLWSYFCKQHKLKAIGVIQGKTKSEMLYCYSELCKMDHIVKIGISCDSASFHQSIFDRFLSKEYRDMFGRQSLLKALRDWELPIKKKKIHLLGCSLPQEFAFYGKNKDFNELIDSVDTSNPVIHAIKNIRYDTKKGLCKKESIKCADLIDYDSEKIDFGLLDWNLEHFKNFCNGK